MAFQFLFLTFKVMLIYVAHDSFLFDATIYNRIINF